MAGATACTPAHMPTIAAHSTRAESLPLKRGMLHYTFRRKLPCQARGCLECGSKRSLAAALLLSLQLHLWA